MDQKPPLTPPGFTPPLGPPSLGPMGPGRGPLTTILITVLGIGTVLFAGLAIFAFNQAQTATKTLDQQKEAAATVARAEQKVADDEANRIANDSPFRSYVAPIEYGSFEIKFPKTWSAKVAHEKSNVQVNLVLNPDFVRTTNGNDELMAARISLQEKTAANFTKNLSDKIKRGSIKQSEITVSNLKATQYTGKFDDNKTSRMVVIPVRDKIVVLINENDKYAREFEQILAQSNILP